jgi:hypothetical protein
LPALNRAEGDVRIAWGRLRPALSPNLDGAAARAPRFLRDRPNDPKKTCFDRLRQYCDSRKLVI